VTGCRTNGLSGAPHPPIDIKRVEFRRRPVREGATVGYVYVEKHGDPAATMTLTFTINYGLVFEDRTNDLRQPLPTNGQRINVTTSIIRDAVWDALWRLRRFAGTTRVATIESASLL
jgi:hypothetical protein